MSASPDDPMAFSALEPKKSRGRPRGSVSAKTQRLRDAIYDLQYEHDVMTVRQVFYALESRGEIPKTEPGYRAVQRQVLEMRKAGTIPWEFIADGTRWQRKPETWDSAEDAAITMARTYRRDLWRAQSIRLEVWLEKDALAGVVAPVTDKWDVALMVSRGVSSATFLQTAIRYADAAADHGIETIIYTLFDYDAGGARARKMIADYFDQYATCSPTILDLAVSREQIDAWELPTRPAKRTDPEAHKWGDVAVELDAIPPDRLRSLIDDAIIDAIDADAWAMQKTIEEEERRGLERLVRGLAR
jgi:hypothetical protein